MTKFREKEYIEILKSLGGTEAHPTKTAEILKIIKDETEEKESNVSKSNHKSKHKHHYEECLIQYEFAFTGKHHLNTSLHTYCTICGKIGDRFKEDKSIVKALQMLNTGIYLKK